MAEKLTILKKIQDDLKNYFNTQNDYRHTPFEIKRGNFYYSDFTRYPVICFTLETDVPYEGQEQGNDIRLLTLIFYVYDHISQEGETDRLLEIIEDLEDFLDNSTHFTYQSDVLSINDISVFEGGRNIETGIASVNVELLYCK